MESLPPWFLHFCQPESDRLTVLAHTLKAVGIPFDLVRTGPFRHLQVRRGRPLQPDEGERVWIAHYDRVAGTPGANDNGASVLGLVDYLARTPGDRSLRVVFTDGEELPPGAPASAQGSYALARHWGASRGVLPFVLDMTGIGDTVVLGHLQEQLIRQTKPAGTPTDLDAHARLRWVARRFLATCGAGDTIEANTPFSDDLGFFLAGVPAVQISLLPRKQALAYRRVRAQPEPGGGQNTGKLPPSWQTMHGPEDRPEALWPSSRRLVAEILDKLTGFPGR